MITVVLWKIVIGDFHVRMILCAIHNIIAYHVFMEISQYLFWKCLEARTESDFTNYKRPLNDKFNIEMEVKITLIDAISNSFNQHLSHLFLKYFSMFTN